MSSSSLSGAQSTALTTVKYVHTFLLYSAFDQYERCYRATVHTDEEFLQFGELARRFGAMLHGPPVLLGVVGGDQAVVFAPASVLPTRTGELFMEPLARHEGPPLRSVFSAFGNELRNAAGAPYDLPQYMQDVGECPFCAVTVVSTAASQLCTFFCAHDPLSVIQERACNVELPPERFRVWAVVTDGRQYKWWYRLPVHVPNDKLKAPWPPTALLDDVLHHFNSSYLLGHISPSLKVRSRGAVFKVSGLRFGDFKRDLFERYRATEYPQDERGVIYTRSYPRMDHEGAYPVELVIPRNMDGHAVSRIMSDEEVSAFGAPEESVRLCTHRFYYVDADNRLYVAKTKKRMGVPLWNLRDRLAGEHATQETYLEFWSEWAAELGRQLRACALTVCDETQDSERWIRDAVRDGVIRHFGPPACLMYIPVRDMDPSTLELTPVVVRRPPLMLPMTGQPAIIWDPFRANAPQQMIL